MLLNTAKVAWKDNKECLNYILDDTTRAFLKLSDKFFYEDMDIFAEDSTKNRLSDIEDTRIKQQQAQEELQQQREQQMLQMQNEVKEEELAIREAELDLQRYKIDQDNQTKVVVAELNAMRGTGDTDLNSNSIPDVAEMAKNEIEKLKISQAQAGKQFDSNIKLREIESKNEIEKRKETLEKQKLDTQIKLQ